MSGRRFTRWFNWLKRLRKLPIFRLSPSPSERRRICALCNLPILRRHKFTHDGSLVKHRVCASPEQYQPVQR